MVTDYSQTITMIVCHECHTISSDHTMIVGDGDSCDGDEVVMV